MDWHQQFLDGLAQPLAPFEQLLDFRVLEYRADTMTATVEFPGSTQLANAIGSVHGGACVAMLDQAMGVAALFAVDFASWFPTLEIKTSFLRAAAIDDSFRVNASVLRIGGSVVFLEARLLDSQATLIATASATARRLDKQR